MVVGQVPLIKKMINKKGRRTIHGLEFMKTNNSYENATISSL